MKKSMIHIPILLAAAILLVVIYIVSRADASPLAKFTQWYSNMIEGFAAPIGDIPKCPTGYRFFNDKRGDSFCCNGTVNPFSHTCEAKGALDLCAFEAEAKDPRNSERKLPSCAQMISKVHKQSQKSSCPDSLQHYGSIGKCCLTDTDLDGYDCVREDNADKKRYCVISNPGPGEQSCSGLKQEAAASCPAGLTKISYTLGKQEQAKYGPKAAMTIPVCFGMEQSCIPNNVITDVQQQGVFSDKTNLDGWKYSCSGYERVHVQRDLTATMDTTYV
jgi:hypothetical protein